MKTRQVKKWKLWTAIFLCVGILGWIDLRTGHELNFFLFYFLPVGLAGWYFGRGASVIMSVISAIVWFFADSMSGHAYSTNIYAVWNTMVRLSAFIAIGWSSSTISDLLLTERKASETLRRNMAEIKLLQGLLPICCECKKIRDDQGEWQQLEAYIGHRSNAQFSHTYCPECYRAAIAAAGLTEETDEPGKAGATGEPRA
ncbi:MAG: DUF4118 domain-containing protein [Verrucomicrobia bacterium]|nr:DUF4118 domain-containing protein [Verrucomicrobiota bacterium]MBU1909396.1 DUF4118 domain-containing protein [Verrucomicrobiota bacterium]